MEQILLPIESALHLPGEIYTSSDIFAREYERIFSIDWLCVGRTEEITKPGDYITTHIMSEPVLITLDEDEKKKRGARTSENTFPCPLHTQYHYTSCAFLITPLIHKEYTPKESILYSFYLGLGKECIDALVPWEKYGRWGGDGFSKYDLYYDIKTNQFLSGKEIKHTRTYKHSRQTIIWKRKEPLNSNS